LYFILKIFKLHFLKWSMQEEQKELPKLNYSARLLDLTQLDGDESICQKNSKEKIMTRLQIFF
jgi:hypothetical protein